MFGLRSEYRELIDGLIENLLSSTAAKILLVPHVFGEQEGEACSSLLRAAGTRYPGRVFGVADPLSERELKWVIGRTQFFIGSRMHACIAALSQGVPAIGLAYSDKFLGVFESAGVGSAIVDLRTLEISEVTSRTLLAWKQREQLKVELRDRMPAVQRDISATFRGLFPRERGRASGTEPRS
jgi:polysaccharide pyruvyl transferase WcaK-like protein